MQKGTHLEQKKIESLEKKDMFDKKLQKHIT